MTIDVQNINFCKPVNENVFKRLLPKLRKVFIVLFLIGFSFSNLHAQCPSGLAITTHPASQSDCYGNVVVFDVTISGGVGPFTYTWQRKKPTDLVFSNIVGDPNISYPTASSMRISPTGVGGNNINQTQYQVVITDACGTITSNPATLTLNDITTITPSPFTGSIVNSVICEGTSFSFTAATVGETPISYKWRRNGIDINDGGAYSGTTTPTLSITNPTSSESGSYSIRVVFPITSNPFTCQQTSSSLTRNLTVNPAATVNAGGPDYVCLSTNPTPITLSGASVGGGATTGAWSILSGGGTLSNTSQQNNAGIASTTYTPPSNLTNNVVLTLTTNDPDGTGPCLAVSAQRTIYPPIINNIITLQGSVPCGSDPTITLLGSTPTGGDGNYIYEWWSSETGNSNWTIIAGQTGINLSVLQNVQTRFYVRRVFSGGCLVESNSIKINQSQVPNVGSFQVTGGGAYCAGGTGVTIFLSSSITGYDFKLVRNNTDTIATLPGTGSALPFTNVTLAGVYTIVAVNPDATYCTANTTGNATVTINPIPTITGTTPNSRCGTGTVVLGATASAGTINWYAASTGGASLGTGTSFTTPSISTTTTYWVDATANSCTTATRTAVIATVNTIPTIISTTPASRCGIGTLTLGATASAGTINWYAAATGGSSLGTGTSYTTPSISTTTTYYVDAIDNGCITGSRTAVIATVNAIPTITGTTPASRCGTGTVTLGATASAGIINWYADPTGGTSLGIGTSFTTPSLSATTIYYADATANGCTTASRTAVTATVNTIPAITGTTPGSRCGTGTVILGATASAGTINWYAAATGGASLGTGVSFTTPSISSTTSYWVDATLSGCTTGTRTEIIATVNNIPTAPTAFDGASCGNGTVVLEATGCSGGTFTWYTQSSGGTSVGSGSLFTTPFLTATTNFYVSCTINGCEGPRSLAIATIRPLDPGSIGSNQTICSGGNPVAFTSIPASSPDNNVNGNITYKWYSGPSSTGPWTEIPGAVLPVYDIPAGLLATTYYYREATGKKTNGNIAGQFTCYVNSNILLVTVNNINAGSITGDQSVCSGGDPVVFGSVAATGDGTITYQWQSNITGCSGSWANISGATSATYDVPAGITQTTYYRRVATSTLNSVACTANSNCITVTVNPLPTINTAATATSVCISTSAQTTLLSYSATTNSPTTYSITWNAVPTNSFVAVTDAALPPSPNTISISIPANTAVGTYTGTITVKNANGCVSIAKTFTITINPKPVTPAISHN